MFARFFMPLIAFLWLGVLAQATEIQWVIMNSDDTDGLIFSGKIIEGDLQKLSQTISMNHWKKDLIIGFNSEGGDMFEAVKIGRYIRHNGFGTIVFDGAHCYSACFFSFIGGIYRRVFEGRLGCVDTIYLEHLICYMFMMELTEEQFNCIAHTLPRQRGNVRISNLQMLNAILYVASNGCKWRALPERYGKWYTVYMRMKRWSQSGVLDPCIL